MGGSEEERFVRIKTHRGILRRQYLFIWEDTTEGSSGESHVTRMAAFMLLVSQILVSRDGSRIGKLCFIHRTIEARRQWVNTLEKLPSHFQSASS